MPLHENKDLISRGFDIDSKGNRVAITNNPNILPINMKIRQVSLLQYQYVVVNASVDLYWCENHTSPDYDKKTDIERYCALVDKTDYKVFIGQPLISVPQRLRKGKDLYADSLVPHIIVRNTFNGQWFNEAMNFPFCGYAMSQFDRSLGTARSNLTMAISGVIPTMNTGADHFFPGEPFGYRPPRIGWKNNRPIPMVTDPNMQKEGRDFFLPEMYKINESNLILLVNDFQRELKSGNVRKVQEWARNILNEILQDTVDITLKDVVGFLVEYAIVKYYDLEAKITANKLTDFVKAIERHDAKNPNYKLTLKFLIDYFKHFNSRDVDNLLELIATAPANTFKKETTDFKRLHTQYDLFRRCNELVSTLNILVGKGVDAKTSSDFLTAIDDDLKTVVTEAADAKDEYIAAASIAEAGARNFYATVFHAMNSYWQSNICGIAVTESPPGAPIDVFL